MKSTKSIALLPTGAVLGASLTSPAANAAGSFFQAQRTPHPIYVDDKQVRMETYAIERSNYVKLRDIGQAVGFEVYWDGTTARIVSGQPYTGQSPTLSSSPIPALTAQDHITEVDPAAFTPELTREMYQGLRNAMLHQSEAVVGTYAPTSLGSMSGERHAELVREFKIADVLESISYEYSYATPLKTMRKASDQKDMSELITLPRFGSFPSRGVVLCVATKGGTQYDKNAERPILRKPCPL